MGGGHNFTLKGKKVRFYQLRYKQILEKKQKSKKKKKNMKYKKKQDTGKLTPKR